LTGVPLFRFRTVRDPPKFLRLSVNLILETLNFVHYSNIMTIRN
jgi:hypothetical protein